MYSERIQNTEIMNHENRFGWHQNNGMTYIYDDDNQYTENYWNTVNPLRLCGTTIVPVDIGMVNRIVRVMHREETFALKKVG